MNIVGNATDGGMRFTGTKLSSDNLDLDTTTNTIIFDGSVAEATNITVRDKYFPQIVNSTYGETYPNNPNINVTEKSYIQDVLDSSSSSNYTNSEQSLDASCTEGIINTEFFGYETTNDVERSNALASGTVSVDDKGEVTVIKDAEEAQQAAEDAKDNYTSSTLSVVSTTSESNSLATCIDSVQPLLNKYRVSKKDQTSISPQQIIAKYGMNSADARQFTQSCQQGSPSSKVKLQSATTKN
ncbi:hypothetical protein [Psittacicella hinzii]|uniref:Uncharacterized protein n=1 Tax=Psittacicella hinzii TaxID=2028575 RepID=A0A3A1YQE4_9GAMM|nr:hypothetical protein [Psittacicella hinzii]RIY39865.1 hypothetical protein CKF58_01480 [Psittacicella hinzii]